MKQLSKILLALLLLALPLGMSAQTIDYLRPPKRTVTKPVKKTKNREEEKKSTPPSKGSPHSENEEAQKRSDPSKTSK